MKIKPRYWIVAAVAIPAFGGALWLWGTQWLAFHLDPFTAKRVMERSISTFGRDRSDLRAANHDPMWDAPYAPFLTNLETDSNGRLILVRGRDRVVLGHRVATIQRSDFPLHPFFVIALEPGDHLVYAAEQSRIPWPNSFEMNWMTGNTPVWKRYRYYRFTWTKPHGETIELFWRFEEFFYASEPDWSDADMTDDDPPCGLVRVTIRPPRVTPA